MEDTQINGWLPAGDLRFAAQLEAIALGVAELPYVTQSIPSAFLRTGGVWRAVGVLAPGDGRNRFVTKDQGLWRGHHVPALLRAYPFRLQDRGGVMRLALWPGVPAEPLRDGVEPFFVDDEPAPLVRQAASFLMAVQAEIDRADPVLMLLDQAGALIPWIPPGFEAPLSLGGQEVRVLDVGALANLPDGLILDLHHQDALTWLYAHLHSLSLARLLKLDCKQVVPDAPTRAFPTPDRTVGRCTASDVLATIAADMGDFEL